MASPEIIDIGTLLNPLSDELPVGSDIRDNQKPDSIYQQIKQARTSARAEERSNLYEKNNNEATQYWKIISQLAPTILNKHSKDLEITSWYIESLVRQHGFQGLRDGLKLIKGLIEQYWEDLFPLPDEDGLLTRIAPLAGLNGEGAEGVLIAPIRNIPMTQGNSAESFAFWQYKQALDLQKITDPNIRTENTDKLGYSIADIEKAVEDSSQVFYVDLRDDINECTEQYRLISQMLDNLCDSSISPPTRNIITVLEQSLAAINHIANHKFPVVEQPITADSNATGSGGVTQIGAINSREAAFTQLHTISEFFLKTEPHSPISYIVAKAVKWGKMPLNELIGELIPDTSSREHFSSLTGVTIKDDDD